MVENNMIPFKDCIYSRRCFVSGEYCSKQANIQKEREELHNTGEINAFVIMNFSNMSDVVYNWRLKTFIERLAEYLEFSNDGIYCKERPGDKVKLEQDKIRKRLKENGRVPVQKINVIRADTNYASNYVVCNRICQQMQIADLIVVDVSSENTNVFYEFGMAVALGKAILPICYSESFFEIQIPDKLKRFEERYDKLGQKEKKNHNEEVERLKRHIDCYPWRRNLFEHYGIRYRSAVDSTALNKDKIDVPDETQSEKRERALKEQRCGYHSNVPSTQYLPYEDAAELEYGFSDIQYARFPYSEEMPGDKELIGDRIYTSVAKAYNNSRYEDNTLVVYTMDGFLNQSQASRCIINYYNYITKRIDEDGCFCGDRVGVLIQDNVVPEGVKDAKSSKHLTYGVGDIIHIGMNEATYIAQREIIKPKDLKDLYNRTEKPEKPSIVKIEESQKAVILEFTKNHLRNRSISIYPNTPVYVKRVKNGVQKDILDKEKGMEEGLCLFHLMLRTLKFTNELVVDISRNPLQSLFWLGAAHASGVDAIVVQHEASARERIVVTGSPEKKERPIFDVAGLWNAIFRSNDTDTFYYQLRLVQEGIEQHSKLMLRDLANYEQCVREHFYKDTLLGDDIIKSVEEKENKEAQVLESYYRDRFWKPMLKYEHLRIFIPQSDGTDSRNKHPKLNAVKWDVDAIANLSHYLSQRTHIGQYSFCTLKKNTFAKDSEQGNMIIVGSDARPLKDKNGRASSLSAYILANGHLAKVNMSTGENLLHSHMGLERYNENEDHYWIYKGFVSYSDNHYHGIFSQIPYHRCYECIESGGVLQEENQKNQIICIQGQELNESKKQTISMPWRSCILRGQGVKHTQLAQLVLWREVDRKQKKVWFRVSMVGASGPSTMALSTLLVNESVRKKAFVSEEEQNLSEEQRNRLQDMGYPLSSLQQTIREKLIACYVTKIDEKTGEKLGAEYKEFRKQIKHSAILYLNSVLYRYFLPFLSLEDEKKLVNGMRYYLLSLYAAHILTEPQVDLQVSEEDRKKQEVVIQQKVFDILDSVEKALETVLEDFRGIEAMYEVEVEITGERNSDSRKLRCILPYQTGGKDYVNCLFVQKESEALSSRAKQQDKGFGGSGETNTVTEKLTVHLHGMESVYTVSAKLPKKFLYESGEIISIQKQENGNSSIFDCLCTEEEGIASIDEKAAAELL